ncbi:MAG: hypothetical protein ACRC62_16495 [Microcoleus sp.]
MNFQAMTGLALANLLLASSYNAPTSTTKIDRFTVTKGLSIDNTSNNIDSESFQSRLLIETAQVLPNSSQGTVMLNRSQLDKLKRLGIPTIVPNYLPQGFRVVDLKTTLCAPNTPQRGECREGSHYSIVYRNERNTCLFVNAIGGGIGGGANEFQYEINTQLLGKVTIVFGKYSGGPNAPASEQLQRPQANLGSFPERLRSTAKSPYYNVEVVEKDNTYGCRQNQSVSPRELEKILQSLHKLD